MTRVVMIACVGAVTVALTAPAGQPRDALPLVVPESVGMSTERLRDIDRAMLEGLAAGGYPGIVTIVGRREGVVWRRGFGRMTWSMLSPPVTPLETMYDVASLTKVAATTMAAMILWDEGRLALEAPVSRYLPEFRGEGRDRVTIEHLLTHRSGLPAAPTLGGGGTPESARRAILTTPVTREPGARGTYSDAGPAILALVVEAIAREPLNRFVERRVFRPLGMRHTTFRPSESHFDHIAPTSPVLSPGVVHDGNSRRLGGVAGHAGLFSTADDLARLALALLNGGVAGHVRIASDSAVERFTRRSAGWRALGWDTCAGGASCGQRMGERAFGHTGFTGTSMWIDPERQLFVIVLTNHVLPRESSVPVAILADVRADIADVATLAMDGGEFVMRSERKIGWR
ncbi:MAG TPA: serine hydrolase [Gemmatimonadaceae bacterium]|nr:serine hydrolase [Gemmatimonadaceae bacterium]